MTKMCGVSGARDRRLVTSYLMDTYYAIGYTDIVNIKVGKNDVQRFTRQRQTVSVMIHYVHSVTSSVDLFISQMTTCRNNLFACQVIV